VEDFKLIRRTDGDSVIVNKTGPELLRYPLLNKGTGFSAEERRQFGIEALLPSQHEDIDRQAARLFKTIFFNKDPVGRHIGLAALQDQNETLFYRVLAKNLEKTMPVVYTPTVGQASQHYSKVFRRPRGLFITPDYRGRIEEVLRSAAPYSDVRLVVVTDNEAILGIGDQGAGGIAISIGKLALYCVGAGIHPARTLPISLDVGTNNESLLEDPLYLGWRHRRLRGEAYLSLVDEFVTALGRVFPNVIVQWEDLRKENALLILDRFRHRIPSFNDDIQGTGAVAAAGVQAGMKIGRLRADELRIVLYGAGAAGLGIARQIRDLLHMEGLDATATARALLVVDSRGVISDARPEIEDYKREMSTPDSILRELGLDASQTVDLERIVKAYRANVLIGVSGQRDAFTEATVRTMATHTTHPIIMPMSNPTAISEAVPADLMRWTDGRALIATGSPFDPVEVDGKPRRIGQANNVFVFPGIGLGAIVSGAAEITETMIDASSIALAASLSQADIDERCLKPEIARLWDVCGRVATAVAEQAVRDGVARHLTASSDVAAEIENYRWRPNYPRIVREMDLS
jgi:malate dehydrogenase (oxaloacetate-decarboxylating)